MAKFNLDWIEEMPYLKPELVESLRKHREYLLNTVEGTRRNVGRIDIILRDKEVRAQ
jgi:hypothetical protein